MSQNSQTASSVYLPNTGAPELPPDPGSRKLLLLLWPLVAVLFGLVIYQQQAGESTASKLAKSAPAVVAPDEIQETMENQTFAGLTRLFIKAGVAMKEADPSAPIGDFLTGLEQQASKPLDQVRLVIATAELKDDTAALARLGTLDANAEIPAPLKADLKTLRMIYEGKKADLTDEQRTALTKNHRKLGEIALSFKDGDTAQRRELLAGGAQLMLLVFMVILLLIGAFISGFIALPILLVLLVTGRLRTHFVPPAPGGSIFVETFAVFLIGFLLLKLVSGALASANPGERWPVYASLAGQWLLLPLVLWPRVRGMSGRSWASAVGLHAGGGFFREVFAGVLGYVAGLPILLVSMLITAVLLLVFKGKDGAPPNPVQEFMQNSDLPLQLMLGLLASAWAPIVEELIFRGGLYRHFRSARPQGVPVLARVFVSAVLSALIFGFMHGYNPLMLLPVITLGFNFALMREWRGSIIPCMTAHALHNGFIMVSMILAVNLLG